MGVGIYFSKENKTTEEYFLGSNPSQDGCLGPFHARPLLSSSATFLALPAALPTIFGTGRQLTLSLASTFCCRPTCTFWYIIPFFRLWKVYFCFWISRRGKDIKVPRIYRYGSFIILQLIRMAPNLFFVSLVAFSFWQESIKYSH